MRCPRCGNENPGTNRFCGMCGATLLPSPAISPAQQAAAQAPTAVSPLPPRSPAPPPASASRAANEPRPTTNSDSEPVISGPSFLGLNQPAGQASSSRSSRQDEPRRGSLSIDPKSAPSSRNLEYLLEDDEPRSGGAGKFILIVVALLLAVGLGYMRWKNQGLGWLGKGPSKPSAAAESPDSSDSTSSAPATNPNSAPASSPSSQGQSSQTPASASPAASSPVAPQPAQNPSATSSAGSPTASPTSNAANSPSQIPPETAAAPASAPSTAADSDDSAKTPAVASTGAAPATKPKPTVPKPTPKPVDPVIEAQKYLYGKGAKQDCERGMHLLKPEADRSNPKAMTEMGALYSAGLCTPRDLPTAYRWFAMALRKNPDDQALQGDLQKLWDEMTQPERQQAIRLTQ